MPSNQGTRFIFLVSIALVGLIALAVGVWLMLPGSALSAYAAAPPTIDGQLGPSEWAGAATKQFTIGQPWSNVFQNASGTIYVMNDDKNLYIAIRITDPTDDGYKDYVQIMFDDTNTGHHTEGDDGVILQPPDNMIDCFWSHAKWSNFYLEYNSDPSDEGTMDCSGAAKYSNGGWTFEISKPLKSADTTHDFQLSKGQTIGFGFVWAENNIPVGGFPESSVYFTGHDDPSIFAKIRIWTDNYLGIALIVGGCLALVATGVGMFISRRPTPPPPT
ncbi:MAG TPA: sugar-binding protein [Thermoproteota archaeon]|nr:sugar-binding protein [Thermoproteota archaeon]